MPVKTRSQTKKQLTKSKIVKKQKVTKKDKNIGKNIEYLCNENKNICLIGSGGVGKTELMSYLGEVNWTNSSFPNRDPFIIKMNYNNKNVYMWDMIGLSLSDIKLSSVEEGMNGEISVFFIMFDIKKKSTFKNACYWIHTLSFMYPETKIVLVGNKIDICKSGGEKTKKRICKKINNICNDFDMEKYISYERISSLSGENVKELFLNYI